MPDQPTFSQFDLYEALRQRKSWAYEHLYEGLLPPFRTWVLRNSGSEMDAEDAFQKGLMNFLLNLETGKYQFRESAKITTVVFDYCKKIWLNELASSRVKTRTPTPDGYDPGGDTDLQADLERGETVTQVRRALGQLKDDCRRLMEFFYFDDLSIREIAQKLGLKETSAKQKRYDCAQKLKGLLSIQIRNNS